MKTKPNRARWAVRLVAIWIGLWGLPALTAIATSLIATVRSGEGAPLWPLLLALPSALVFFLVAAALYRFHPLGRLAGLGMLLLHMLVAALLVYNAPQSGGPQIGIALVMAVAALAGYTTLNRPQVKDLFRY